MDDLYLIAHKVRGQPAFDIAERMECPICEGTEAIPRECEDDGMCPECDHGYWWMLPTIGHRAYPYWTTELRVEGRKLWVSNEFVSTNFDLPVMSSDWPDHYQCDIDTDTIRQLNSDDVTKAVSLLESLGLVKPKQPIKRRV